jgi:hypothetical protein
MDWLKVTDREALDLLKKQGISWPSEYLPTAQEDPLACVFIYGLFNDAKY